jgi:hypothetical protein
MGIGFWDLGFIWVICGQVGKWTSGQLVFCKIIQIIGMIFQISDLS